MNPDQKRLELLNKYKFVYDYEWEVIPGRTNEGIGDLVFTDGKSNFLIVECKNQDVDELRRQVLYYIKKFREIHSDAIEIEELAVHPNRWDFLPANLSSWDFGISNGDKPFYILCNDNANPEEIENQTGFQRVYVEIGYGPKDPISALKVLEEKSLISVKYKPIYEENQYSYKAKLTVLKDLPEKFYDAESKRYESKKLAKAKVAAKLCKKVYLPYYLND
ncbi:MAG: hypothetical protein P8Y70_18055 [Candidatus Lokiarchaeota archaeon]